MTSINDNNLKDKGLKEKVNEYLAGKINSLEDKILLLIDDAKSLGFETAHVAGTASYSL